MDILKKSKKYVPGYVQIQQIKKEAKEIWLKAGIEKGLKEGKKEMAKAMKVKGEPLEKIMKYTGLSATEIKRIKVGKTTPGKK